MNIGRFDESLKKLKFEVEKTIQTIQELQAEAQNTLEQVSKDIDKMKYDIDEYKPRMCYEPEKNRYNPFHYRIKKRRRRGI